MSENHPPSSRSIDPRAFRQALGAFPTGVTVMTTQAEDGRDIGLTVNSFNSVSLDPPLVLWSLSNSASSRQAFDEVEHFAVHVLTARQEDLATRFATPDIDRFAGLGVERGIGNVPLLRECAARFVCRIAYRYEGGDHLIIVGEVLSFDRREEPVLAFHGGKYALAYEKAVHPNRPRDDDAGGAPIVQKNALNMLLGVAYRHLVENLDPHLQARGLNEADFWTLNMVGAESGRDAARLNKLLGFREELVTKDVLDRLAGEGLVSLGEGVSLTEKGRQVLMELEAEAKSVETNAEAGLDYAEALLLHQLLRRLIFSMRG
ncbi:flavin reductase family protein [Parvularcula marina]|nr:flavin reductase family protein [Parvularcula marina]